MHHSVPLVAPSASPSRQRSRPLLPTSQNCELPCAAIYETTPPQHTACFKHSDQSKQSLWVVCMHPLTLITAYTGIVQDSLADGRSRVLDSGMPGGFVFWLAAPSCKPTAPMHTTAWAATLPLKKDTTQKICAAQKLDPAMSIGSRCSTPPQNTCIHYTPNQVRL